MADLINACSFSVFYLLAFCDEDRARNTDPCLPRSSSVLFWFVRLFRGRRNPKQNGCSCVGWPMLLCFCLVCFSSRPFFSALSSVFLCFGVFSWSPLSVSFCSVLCFQCSSLAMSMGVLLLSGFLEAEELLKMVKRWLELILCLPLSPCRAWLSFFLPLFSAQSSPFKTKTMVVTARGAAG